MGLSLSYEERQRAFALADALHAWPREERERWRALADSHPREALLLAELILDLDAWPTDEDGVPLPSDPKLKTWARVPGRRTRPPQEFHDLCERLGVKRELPA